jgi:nucleoside 2-deoxyribosyltransferase
MIHVLAPNRPNLPKIKSVFLAGSIEMGKAENWQNKLVNMFKNEEIIFFNPRRDTWNSNWVHDPTPGTKFHEQVEWELDYLKKADFVIFYFDPKTQSPITLLELGYVVGMKKEAVICCPDGYYRKGNVVMTSKINNIPVLNTFNELYESLLNKINFNI